MIPRERGFLLLTSRLGDPDRRPLSLSQVRFLSQRVRLLENFSPDAELTADHLMSCGISQELSQRVITLLADGAQLDAYRKKAEKLGIFCLTRAGGQYPQTLYTRLGFDSPGSLWCRGDLSILNNPGAALVGSRDLHYENREFAERVGIQAARQGYILISGNARGADSVAQEACLRAGGKIISIVADRLADHPERDNVLYVSEDGFEEPFSAQRALHRNHIIHALGMCTFAAQCSLGKGGTWSGCNANLKNAWTPLYCFRDGSQAAAELEQRGAICIGLSELTDFSCLPVPEPTLFDY